MVDRVVRSSHLRDVLVGAEDLFVVARLRLRHGRLAELRRRELRSLLLSQRPRRRQHCYFLIYF